MNKFGICLSAVFLFIDLSGQVNSLPTSHNNKILKNITVKGKQLEVIAPEKKIKLILVKGGEFIMGGNNPRTTTPYYSDLPKHSVRLDDYYLAETEVTQSLWKSIMNNNPCEIKGDSLPMYNVSWNVCQEFILKLNQVTGKKYRLPTEAEWEYAAGGGERIGSKFSGTNLDSELTEYAWVLENSEKKLHPVATKKPNKLGFYDMTGNVWEWCSDYLGAYPSTPQINPKGVASSTRRVSRGGSWVNPTNVQKLTLRWGFAPESCNRRYGFRLAMSVE